ncbi:MAG: UDP-glucose/GDP-mannose dehydrogenase family protein [Acidimicrobiia bacterium]|nr:UDP-glucose/GDP-mannose dehydrogenase family protein [Acidimicrobiia bacterium]NNL69637.1 UDP-glucose/GDP-mannose dehydrogenase family protein [Acidimicrobiia bacterium]
MQVAVIGAGYVGLVTGAGLAYLGHSVRLGERDEAKLAKLSAGQVPFFEAGLDRLLGEGIANKLLSFHSDNTEAVDGAKVVFLALPTPPDEDGSADTSYIEGAIEEIGPVLQPGTVVVLKSTVPVGSVARFQARLDTFDAGATVISNPEFLREGSAVGDFLHPDRIVIGTRNQEAAEVMMALYQSLQAPVVVTDPASSEMIKYASNAYLATRITFANAIANLCESVGADVKDVLLGMGYDRRVGFHFLNPGPGYGGSCFPKDTRALVAIAESAGYDFSLLKGVIEVNELQRHRVIDKVKAAVDLDGATIGLWGLAFKAGTDDIRESPAVFLAEELMAAGSTVQAFDPEAAYVPGVIRVDDAVQAAKEADVLLIATEWPEFQSVDLRAVRDVMAVPHVIDARNMLDPEAVRRLGMQYEGIGR